MSSQKPLGVFDSGIGGLTVAKAITTLLPDEQLIYFGDTAHFPYGDKERGSVQKYCEEISDYLLTHNCKALVIACNTASSACATSLKKHLPAGFPLINVIQPVVDHVANNNSNEKVGIIATKGTTNSRIYPNLIHKNNNNLQVASVATPLLAPMIEEGFYSNNISRSIIASYLSKSNIQNIDSLILGCTHYPIIEHEIKDFYASTNQKIEVINSAKIVANALKKQLSKLKILSNKKSEKHLFFVSDYTTSFEESTKIFFGETVKLTKMPLWK
ncbi:MAG: glutamate racemase [Glaciecola sp.]|jgi:glutamate racemase